MILSNQTDAQVVSALYSGDLSALGILYQRHGEIVYRVTLRILGNQQEAEDLTQEVFLTLWRNKAYDPTRGSILAFLITLSRSKAIDRYRQVQAQRRLQQRWSYSYSQQPKSELIDKLALKEISLQVRKAVEDLPTIQRSVLVMAYFDGLTQSEIAHRLNIPLGTVKTHKRTALLKLREILNNFRRSL